MKRQLAYGTRLTLANTAIVAVAVVLLGAVAFVTVGFALDNAFETRLETTAEAIRSIVEVRNGGINDLDKVDLEQFQALLGQGLNGAIYRSDGSLMVSNLAAPPATLLADVGGSASLSGLAHVDRGATRFVVFAIVQNGLRYGTIVDWESRGVYRDAQRITLIALIAAGLVVIAAAAAAGGTLTRRMLLPVTDLSAMISDIEAANLSERLAWDGPNDELGRLCVTFDRLLDRLETAFQRERRFIADASHELRTPLSVMRAEVELALMQERTPEAYRTALQRLQRETRRLEVLAQSLILTSRGDGGRVERAVPAAGIAARATARMEPLSASHNIALACDTADVAHIDADPEMLERAIVALIDNALRFARSAVAVAVSVDGMHASIAVSDDGPGFSDRALHEATRRFWREDPARSGEGTGLGLAIARSIVERHNGTIALHNVAGGGGAVVVLLIPLASAAVT